MNVELPFLCENATAENLDIIGSIKPDFKLAFVIFTFRRSLWVALSTWAIITFFNMFSEVMPVSELPNTSYFPTSLLIISHQEPTNINILHELLLGHMNLTMLQQLISALKFLITDKFIFLFLVVDIFADKRPRFICLTHWGFGLLLSKIPAALFDFTNPRL